MLYYVQYGDSLYSIASRYQSNIRKILNANVICNPDIIQAGKALIVPSGEEMGDELPRSGGLPYYITEPGDTLFCLSAAFGASIDTLAANNRIADPNLIFPGMELLVLPVKPDAGALRERWVRTARLYCGMMSSLMEHGIFFIGTYEWQALGRAAIPHLLELLKNPYGTVRFHAAMSLGRIAEDGPVVSALRRMKDDKPHISEMAEIALRRIELAGRGMRRVHITFSDSRIHKDPDIGSPSFLAQKGTEVIVLQWHMPSPTGEEGPRGDVQIYDRVLVTATGQSGFLPRVGFSDPPLV